ncbi:MAG TPA: hypothetical protein VIK78_06915 [Ruminiclostridium sp.]
MTEKIIGIITNGESDFLDVIKKSNITIQVMKPDDIGKNDLNSFFSIVILGGSTEQPILFRSRDRVIIERYINSGKRVFSEYCASIGHIYFASPEATRFEKLVFCAEDGKFGTLQQGDLLDDQCNSRIKPFDFSGAKKRPILQYTKSRDHSRTIVDDKLLSEISDMALWFDDPENLLICNFRIENFVKARFSPADRWKSLVKYILNWICGEEIDVGVLNIPYHLKSFDSTIPFEKQVKECINNSISWFDEAGILINNGLDGVMEGPATEIYPDGKQRVLSGVRNDCTAETSLAFFMKYLMSKNMKSKEISDNLISLCFDVFQYKEKGPLKGMLRWTQTGWGTCYQDDSARVLISQLLKCLYSGDKTYLEECVEALHFLVRTTGTDGTRVYRTDNSELTEERLQQLASTPTNHISAHYNAYYMGSLLLAYKITGIEEFKSVGIKGLETLMSAYPETIREHSETQEICRLIMPLAWLYWVTGDKKHKDWLYRVTEDLVRFKHPSGGYLEWDTGYKSDIKESAESSLLAKNGDPVVDLLYSLNWLPMGFIQAYFVTKDPYFKELWVDIAKFFVSAQIHSSDRMINGTWTRALDVELMEVYGLAADAGWGPWAIESGWTVAEVTSGLISGIMSEDLCKFY